MPDEYVSIPPDLTLIGSMDELHEMETNAIAEFDRIKNSDNVTSESVSRLMELNEDIQRVRAELKAREVRAQAEADALARKNQEARDALDAQVHGRKDKSDTEGGSDGSGGESANAESIATATARAVTASLLSVLGDRGGELAVKAEQAASLATVQRMAPPVPVPKRKLAITAGVDIPGRARGQEIAGVDDLVEAFHARAKGLPDGAGLGQEHLVASIRREFEHVIDDRTSLAQMEDLLSNYLVTEDKKDALVAGGGWCAPSQILYDFFAVDCVDGLIDLPTIGVTRGGIQFPTSPSLADANIGGVTATFSNTSTPWLWTETDDILTVTGAVNKPVVRVPCPGFNTERLECYGINLTAGNLTNDAYPEATRRQVQLLINAHQHAMNQRLIALMVAKSSTIVNTGSYAVTGMPVVTQVLNGAELAAVDYRTRYGMCDNDVLEIIYPLWLKAEIRADLAWRTGVQLVDVTDAQINGYFTSRKVRPQWVGDYQVRGASQFGGSSSLSAWPTSFDFMIYAAGTFVKGNGLTLNLGVIRDSVLNAENDYTAQWSEECHLIAKVGHESRQYRTQVAVSGAGHALLTATAL